MSYVTRALRWLLSLPLLLLRWLWSLVRLVGVLVDWIPAAIGVALLVGIVAAGYWSYRQLQLSLPQLEGELAAGPLAAAAKIERDGKGVVTIRGENRRDVAFAMGFAHAQDRYFQMDLLRRNSAGEMSELIGSPMVDHDLSVRVHQFRKRALAVAEAVSAEDRDLIAAYTEGVNAGLKSLKQVPFEYLVLRTEPAEWKSEDCVLVLFSMYLELQDGQPRVENTRGLLHDVLPPKLAEFLSPLGCEWDASLAGDDFALPEIPGPEVIDLRSGPQAATSDSARWRSNPLGPDEFLSPQEAEFHPGSNNWAVGGKLGTHGGAIVANDMHLGIDVPHIWYRARLMYPDPTGPVDITGVTLPGTPAVVVGSNGHVAWGFTNSEGDWADLVVLEIDPQNPNRYRTPDGWQEFVTERETIYVKGDAEEELEVQRTIWGPVYDEDHQGRPRALRWVAHDPDGVNLGLLRMETAKNIQEAMERANLSGSPAQNFAVVDSAGNVGWTILGRMPKRVGWDGLLPRSWADGACRWDGYREPADYPRVLNPENSRIWTANARVASGEMLKKVGFASYDLGARASQIRDDLLAKEQFNERDMLAIQLDDRALCLERWQKLLLATLKPEHQAQQPYRKQMKQFVEDWGGHASIDSVGFALVRSFRTHVRERVLTPLVRPCLEADPRCRLGMLEACEEVAWKLLQERPMHLLDPKYKDWDELLLDAADGTLADVALADVKLEDYTWGHLNTTRIRHPLSKAMEMLPYGLNRPVGWLVGKLLDMPAEPLAGDSSDMPRIQLPAGGASERMAVSPGKEAEGFLHMPCGQSGHPLSPHYRDQHEAWARGEFTPFLPGPTVHTLTLRPGA